MPFTVYEGPTIPAGESVSDSIDCTKRRIIRVGMPAEWTPATLSVLASFDNVSFFDLLSADGRNFTVEVVSNTQVSILADWSLQYGYFKFMSGTTSRPVIQEETRVFTTGVVD